MTRETFSMTLAPDVDAMLVFDASEIDETGDYVIYAIKPSAGERFEEGGWELLRERLTPAGRVSASEVEFDEISGYRLRLE